MVAITKAKCEQLFLDWFNNFLTIQAIADYYGWSDKKMLQALKIGRKVNNSKINIADLEFPF